MGKTNFEVDKNNLEVLITRVFDATPERMWQAFSNANQIAKWWEDITVNKFEFKVGGAWRFVSGEHGEHAFRGEYKEIDEPNKISRTFEYEPMPGHVLTETVTFKPQDGGKTLYTQVNKFENMGDLEGMVSMGMEQGSQSGLDRLAKVVENN